MRQKFEIDVATILVAVVGIFLVITLVLNLLFPPTPTESEPTAPVSRPNELADCLSQVQESNYNQASTDEAIDNCYQRLR